MKTTRPNVRGHLGSSIVVALLLLLTCFKTAQAQGIPIKQNEDIYIRLGDHYLLEPESSKNWPAARHGGKQSRGTHKLMGDKPGAPLNSGDVVGIQTQETTHPGYNRMYQSVKSWAYYDTAKGKAEANEQWWTLERRAGDGQLKHGDEVRFRNRYWTDYFLNFSEDGYWVTVSKNPSWLTIESTNPVPPVVLTRERKVNDILEVVVYVKNLGNQQILSGKESWTLSESDEVGIGSEKTDTWDVGVSVGVQGKVGPVETSLEVSTSFGQTFTEQKTRVKGLNVAKSVELNYTVPVESEAFLKARITVPYKMWDASCAGVNVQLRALNDNLTSGNLEVLTIPTKVDGQIEPIPMTEIDNCLDLLALKDPELAADLRNNRLKVWIAKKWVEGQPTVTLPKFARIKNVGTNKWLTHEGGVSNQNWISSTTDKSKAVVWELVGDANRTTFKAKDTNLYLSYRGTTGACKFLDSDQGADYQLKFLQRDNAWSIINNSYTTPLWIAKDPYAYVSRGDAADSKTKWIIEEFKPDNSSLSAQQNLNQLPGRYRRNPVENGWHEVEIRPVPGTPGKFQWKNKDDISWNLLAKGNTNVLRSDNSNPYFNEGVDTLDTIVEFRNNTNEVSRVIFRNDTYERVGSIEPAKPKNEPVPVVVQQNLTQLPGRYRRSPVENGWHEVEIRAVPGIPGKYQWKNKDDISWNLMAKGNTNVLRSDNTNPYFDEGVNTLDTVVEFRRNAAGEPTNEISGVIFRNDTYERIGSIDTVKPKNPSPAVQQNLSRLPGRYRRDPVENGWHEVEIRAVPGTPGKFQWRNKEDVSWNLFAKGNTNELRSDNTNPYFNEGLENLNVTVEFRKTPDGQPTNDVSAIIFHEEKYDRVSP